MQRSFAAPFVMAVILATPLIAADTLPWPWTSKMPPDPALVVLPKVASVSASADKAIVNISVKATAPTPDFTELKLTPRIGDPKDRIFAFDVRGRAPQGAAGEVLTDVTIEASYTDAPLGKFDVIEVYAKDNCVAYSLTEAKQVECTSKSVPQ